MATLDLTTRATADWLAGKQDHTRAAHLEYVRSWLSHCQGRRVNPLTATPWEIITWINALARTDTPVPLAKCVTSVRSWYAHLVRRRICARDPTQQVQLPSAEPIRPRVRAHTVLASAVLVDYSDARASDTGPEAASEAAWRDAALLAVWFYTGIAPPPLLVLELSALTVTSSGLWLAETDDSDRVPLTGHADRLVRGYLERRSARMGQHVGQLRGPLLATTPTEEGGSADLPLTNARVLTILRVLADHCGLPHRSRLSPSCAALPGKNGQAYGPSAANAAMIASGTLSVINWR